MPPSFGFRKSHSLHSLNKPFYRTIIGSFYIRRKQTSWKSASFFMIYDALAAFSFSLAGFVRASTVRFVIFYIAFQIQYLPTNLMYFTDNNPGNIIVVFGLYPLYCICIFSPIESPVKQPDIQVKQHYSRCAHWGKKIIGGHALLFDYLTYLPSV